MSDTPEPPAGLGDAGRQLWADVHEQFDALTATELALLHQACAVADRLAELDAVVRRDGVVIETVAGEPRAHPAAVEHRLQQVNLARLIAAMRLPDSDGVRPQHRQARGVYQTRRLRGIAG